jgi:hypothetical protein
MPGLHTGTFGDFRPVDLSELHITSPTVVYLPGRGQSDSEPEELSKGVHFVNKLFSEIETPPDVYIWSHADKYNKKHTGDVRSIFHVAAVSYIPGYSSQAGQDLAKGLIMPLVADAEGKPLPYQQAQDNLRNLTLLGYCLGSTTAQELYNASLKMMYDAGYPRGQARLLLREVVLVSFANLTHPRKERHGFTTISIVNTGDAIKQLVKPVTSVITLPEKLLVGAFSRANEKLTIQTLSGTSALVTFAATASLLDRVLGRNRKEIIDGVKLQDWKPDPGHAASNYVTDAENSQVAGMVKKAVVNSAGKHRERRPSPLDLLTEVATHTDTPEAIEQYNSRIERAMHRGDRPALNVVNIFR